MTINLLRKTMTLRVPVALLCMLGFLTVLPLSAATINLISAGLFNTGVDNTGAPISGGATDTHWSTLQNGAAFSAQSNNQAGLPYTNWPLPNTQLGTPGNCTGLGCAWAPSATAGGTPVSQWISFQSNVNTEPASSLYEKDYVETFTLAGFDFTTVEIVGVFAVDDLTGGIQINGHAVTTGGPAFMTGGPNPKIGFDITNASCAGGCFQAGVNTFTFRDINQSGSNAPDPSGILIEFTSGTANALGTGVPEPATLFGVGLGLSLVGLIYRRRRS